MIWDEMYRYEGSKQTDVFFVGTEQEFKVAENLPIR